MHPNIGTLFRRCRYTSKRTAQRSTLFEQDRCARAHKTEAPLRGQQLECSARCNKVCRTRGRRRREREEGLDCSREAASALPGCPVATPGRARTPTKTRSDRCPRRGGGRSPGVHWAAAHMRRPPADRLITAVQTSKCSLLHLPPVWWGPGPDCWGRPTGLPGRPRHGGSQ